MLAVMPDTTNIPSNGSRIWNVLPPVTPVRNAFSKALADAPIPKLAKRASIPLAEQRSTAKDGLENQIQAFITTHGEPIWKLIQTVPPVRRVINAGLTNMAILKFPTRPNPLSTMADYTSWDSLTDRTWSGRHLPSAA
ncbi:MAG: prostaglandin-endoperoxide synthase 2, partial [Solirubrobacteraceae bacterium]|nr:prostaglandin-endoperoxide synthase 2 [Solirubrobacteraceae bacterium]